MPLRQGPPQLMRVVVGTTGTVRMTSDLRIRFDYGSIVPWVRRIDGGIVAVGGRDGLVVRAPVPLHGRDHRTEAAFDVHEGDHLPFTLPGSARPTSAASVDDCGDPLVSQQRTEG